METESSKMGEGKEVVVAKKKTLRISDLLLRFMALALTLAAAVTVALDKQTKVVPISLVPSLPPLNVPVTAIFHDLSAFTYFVVANCITCAYGVLSLILILANRGKRNGVLAMVIIILDLVMVALLASSLGAATAVGVLGLQGNEHVHWDKVCNVFGKFCHQVAGAVVVSFLGSISYLFLVMLAVLDLHHKKNY